MENTTVQAYSFVLNIKEKIDKENEDISGVYKLRQHQFRYIRPNVLTTFKRVYNDLENCVYSYKNLAVYMWYKYGIGNPINVYIMDTRDIKEVNKLFTSKQLEKDKEFIKNINKQLKFNSIDEYFTINESGESVIYELIKKNYISPVFFVRYFRNDLTMVNKDVSFISVSYKQFEYSMKCLIKIFKGDLK